MSNINSIKNVVKSTNEISFSQKGELVKIIRGLLGLPPRGLCQIIIQTPNGKEMNFEVIERVDTVAELNRIRVGGILQEA